MQLSSKLDHSNILNHMDEIIKTSLIEENVRLETGFIFVLPHSLNLDFQCQLPTNVHTGRMKMSITFVCSFLNLYISRDTRYPILII
jgi:lauroyl/myristoyl acyltransferase